jgi:hypothetical protein
MRNVLLTAACIVSLASAAAAQSFGSRPNSSNGSTFGSSYNRPRTFNGSSLNFENSDINWNNSNLNPKNNSLLGGDRTIYDGNGKPAGYAAPNSHGVNIFDNNGNRQLYVPYGR